MGTRGSIGFRLNDKDCLTYNHYDSYPDGLGVAILRDLRTTPIEELKALAEKLKVVSEDVPPTDAEVEALSKFANLNVGKQDKKEWYCLLRELQGELLETLKTGYMIEGNSFIKDSLFCEWAYIVNFDTNELEVYRGFQKVKANIKGRYAKCRRAKGDEYYACSLVKTYPLSNLPSDEDFVKKIDPPDEE